MVNKRSNQNNNSGTNTELKSDKDSLKINKDIKEVIFLYNV